MHLPLEMDLKAIADTLRSQRSALAAFKVVTGFDAFVDEMITVVGERKDLNHFERVETISRFGELVSAAAGHSSLREIVVTQTDPGGCAINMGDGLATLGIPVHTFATAGEPIHPAFDAYRQKASLHSWGREPGRTLAYEFADGKLMFSAVSQLAEFTPGAIENRLQDGFFQETCHEARLITLTNWTLYPHMTACWQRLQESVFSKLTHRPPFFLDLVDPSSRSEKDILGMLAVLPGFDQCGPTTLGLNQNEANILSRLTGGKALETPDVEQACEQAAALMEKTGISEVVIHSVKYAALANSSGRFHAAGPYCEKPLKLTGAGDRFNAGYALGLILELPPVARLLLAGFVSGLYVRLGRSATLDELIDFMEQY